MGMMINRRRVMGGKALPYDAEIEYLESSGTQFIDTGVIPLITDYIYVEFYLSSPLSEKDGGGSIYGTMLGWGKNAYGLGYVPYKNLVYPLRGNHDPGGGYFVNRSAVTNVWQNLILDNTVLSGYGRTITMSGSESNCLYSGYLFCFCFANGTWGLGGTKRIRKFQHKRNEQLIMDMIPVRIGTVGYMYDKVSGQLFGNAGTGSFILGPNI